MNLNNTKFKYKGLIQGFCGPVFQININICLLLKVKISVESIVLQNLISLQISSHSTKMCKIKRLHSNIVIMCSVS